MRLKDITAAPHPSGNRIDISWTNPDPAEYPGVIIYRQESTHPVPREDDSGELFYGDEVIAGVLQSVSEDENGESVYKVTDEGLKGETVYYYSLFPYQNDPNIFETDRHNRASAMATSPFDMAGQMMALLPAVYHRYDAARLPVGSEHMGQLRRFLDIVGGQLGQLYSYAQAALNLYDIDKVDGRLLQLLAQWIGWDTNFRLDVGKQRNELRSAPSLYKTVGIVPTVESTVKRVLGWESRAKEFVHNVALSNTPERLNIWTHTRDTSGVWTASTAPLSIDSAFEGRTAAVYDDNGVLWLFYHTRRNNHWDIWYKTLTTFDIPTALQDDLDNGAVSTNLIAAFESRGFRLSYNVSIESNGVEWLIEDHDSGEVYTARLEDGQLNVYRWTPSEPLTNSNDVDKHPTAVYHGSTLYLCWDSFNESMQAWSVKLRTMTGGEWSDIQTLGSDGVDRKNPAILFDHTDHLWMFWLEKNGTRWQLKYQRRDENDWILDDAHTFPLDGEVDPEATSDLFVLFQSAESTPDDTPRIWVFWSRKVSVGIRNETRWQIAYRVATSIDPNELTWIHTWSPETPDHLTVDSTEDPPDLSFATWYVNKPLDWSAVQTLPIIEQSWDAREPAAFFNANGDLELFFSSNRNGSWSVWNAELQAIGPPTWTTPAEITSAPYSQRAPFPIQIAGGTLLLYRSNESVRYTSDVYRATETVDFRYAGATAVDSQNVVRLALRERYDDFQTYVLDTGRSDRDWYARDTVGIYLNAETEDPNVINRNRNLINNILRQFLPIQVRVVFIIPIISREVVYVHGGGDEDIGEQYSDSLDTLMSDTFAGLADDYTDTMAGWVWVRSWSPEFPEHFSVDFEDEPIDTNFRTVNIGLEAGG